MRARLALQLNALVGLLSAAAATAMISLVLTRPTYVAASVAQHDYGSLASAMAGQVVGWLQILLRFL